jgi:ABC-2 type transport system permease protein
MAGEVPAGEVPAGEVPAGEVPAGEAPAGEVPAGEVPAGEAGSASRQHVPAVPLWSRLYGLGSIYAKTLRDSRLAFLIAAGLLGGMMAAGCKAFGAAYPTAASRVDLANVINNIPPVLKGLYSSPVNVETLGGSLSWKYGPFFALIAGLWSIVALSGTLASEARRGSLDMVAAAPFGKRRIAVEKLAAHLTGMSGAMVFLAFVTYFGSQAFSTQPNDAVPLSGAVGFALWVGLIGLVSGSVAWALAPFAGRASAAGVAGAVMLGGFVISGYQASVPAVQPLANLTWFHWTADHLPLAGQYDWASLIPVAIVAVVLFAVGIIAFDRRDLGATSAIPAPAMPQALLGVGGPGRRALGERLPLALAWGIGLAIYAALIAASSRSFADELHKSPDTYQLFATLFKGYDISTGGGFLQLMFTYLGFIVAGLGASTLVAGWASDENDRRLELLLASPLGRARWAISGGLGVLGGIAVMTAVAMAGIALGVASAGTDVLTPTAGALVIGLYAAAVAGIGFAVGGFVRNTVAGEVVAVVVIATFLVDFLAPLLNLPDWVHQLALTSHLGEPMVGIWDPVGMAFCAVVAVAGLLLGAVGMQRRDIV